MDKVLSIFCVLLLLSPSSAAAIPSYDYFSSSQKPDVTPYACSPEEAKEMLEIFIKHVKKSSKAIVVANWYLHPDGFAFRIPDGLSLAKERRSLSSLFDTQRTVSFVDPLLEDAPFQTLLTVSIANEDKQLHTMKRTDADRFFANQFEQFSLLDFSHILIAGEEGIYLTFLTGKTPRLHLQQCMFVKNGQTYIATMASENRIFRLAPAAEQFNAFLDTLFFADISDTVKGSQNK